MRRTIHNECTETVCHTSETYFKASRIMVGVFVVSIVVKLLFL